MGVTDAFTKANALLASELGFQLDPSRGNTAFRTALYFAGWRRFEHCVALVKLGDPKATPVDRVNRITQLMKLVTPPKSPDTQYRNPEAQAAVEQGRAMDAEAMEAAANDRCRHGKRGGWCPICDPVSSVVA